ncbi:MAG: diguanylate cyclase [Desulfobulbaceae bacterium]|nr:diguanylate cyclase [Desulfobulbaceae bacterium]
MNALDKFNIKEKMLFGYLPVVLVIAMIAISSLQSLSDFERINRDIVQYDTVLVQAADEMVDNLLAQEAYGRRYIILASQKMLDLYKERDSAFNALVERVRALPYSENIHIEQIASLHDEINELYAGKFFSVTHQTVLPQEYNDKKIQARLDEAVELIRHMGAVGRLSQQQKMQTVSTIGSKTFRTTLLLSCIGILVSLAVVSLITRTLSRAISQLKQSAEMVSEGRYDCSLQLQNKDELGELARSFGNMTQRLASLEEMHLDSNPLTRLPGGTAIEKVLQGRLAAGKKIAFCMLDLDNFKSFNDRYGYAQGNEIIKATAQLIKSTVDRHTSNDNFVGHIGGDDFAIIVTPLEYEPICKTIVEEFDRMVLDFYSADDKEKGYIVGNTRQGLEVRFPIMTISIAVVATDNFLKQMNYIEIGEMAAELKEHAKSIPGSVYVVNRRGRRAMQRGFKPQLVGKRAI